MKSHISARLDQFLLDHSRIIGPAKSSLQCTRIIMYVGPVGPIIFAISTRIFEIYTH